MGDNKNDKPIYNQNKYSNGGNNGGNKISALTSNKQLGNQNRQSTNTSNKDKNTKINKNSLFNSNYIKESLSSADDILPNIKQNPFGRRPSSLSSTGQNVDRLYLPPKGYLPPTEYLPPGSLELPK